MDGDWNGNNEEDWNVPLHIEISEKRLSELPEDGIPEELTTTVKHSMDIETVEREYGGYVPTDAADDMEIQDINNNLKHNIVDVHQSTLFEAGLIEIDENGEDETIGIVNLHDKTLSLTIGLQMLR